MTSICVVCYAPALKRCARCQGVRYCGKEHQLLHWKTEHKLVCVEKKRTKQLVAETVECMYTSSVLITDYDRFAMHEYARLTDLKTRNADTTRIVEGICIFKLLHKQNTQHNRLFACFALMIAESYYRHGCKSDMEQWIGNVHAIDPTIDVLTAYFTQKQIDDNETGSLLTIQVAFGPYTRSKQTLEKGLWYFTQHLHTKSGIKIILDENVNGYDVLATQDFAKGEIICEESAVLVASLDVTLCYHCTSQILADTKIACACGLEYCSQKCQHEAFDIYHDKLCNVAICTTYKEMCTYLAGACKSSSGKFPLLEFKMLGMALKNKLTVWDLYPFKFLHTVAHTWSLSVMPKHMSYLFDALITLGLYEQSKIDFEWLLHVTNILVTNTFATEAGEMKVNEGLLGSSLFLANVLSLLNHSCFPNASWKTVADKMQITATRDIAKGDSIRINYGSDGNRSERQANLKMRYGFDCRCEICSLGTI